MINLLPHTEKRKLQKEFRMRYAVTALWTIFMLEVTLFALLAPSYLKINLTMMGIEDELAAKKAIAIPGGDNVQNGINKIKSEIALLKPTNTNADIVISQLMTEILAQKPEGVSIGSFAYGRSGNAVTMQLSGNASTREDLLFFQRLLKDNMRIADAKYSQNFITKKTDIDFMITITLK